MKEYSEQEKKAEMLVSIRVSPEVANEVERVP